MNAEVSGAWCLAGLSLARRLYAKGQDERGRRLAIKSIPYVLRWYDEQDADVRTDTIDAVEDLTLLAIQSRDNELLKAGLLTLSIVLTGEVTTATPGELREIIPPNVRIAGLFAYAHLSAELNEDDVRHTTIRVVLDQFKNPVYMLDFWLEISRDAQLPGASQMTYRYHDVWG